MHLPRPTHQDSGLTLIEGIVVVASLCMLIVILLPALGTTNRKAPLTACLNNLKQVVLGQQSWANDHSSTNLPVADARFGRSASSGDLNSYYKALSNELISPRILVCPTDTRASAQNFASLTTNHLSYFLNLDATSGFDPSIIVNGERHLQQTPPRQTAILTLQLNHDVSWNPAMLHGKVGNLAFMDGSVMKTAQAELNQQLRLSRADGHRLLFP